LAKRIAVPSTRLPAASTQSLSGGGFAGFWQLATGYWRLLYHFLVHALASRLLKAIRKHHSLRAGDRVAAAVSGGADSVALLHLLLELRSDLGVVLSVAHVNHKLRGEESNADQRFVAELARQHDLEFHTFDAPVEGNNHSGIEAAARELRYSFFRRLATENGLAAGELSGSDRGSQHGSQRGGQLRPTKPALKIATAHTLDDQAETVLLRIFRGTGIRGLSGIHSRIVFAEQGRAFGEIIRPLLGLRRTALLEFLRERGQSWREDSSNRDVAFLRNRVRHRLLPMIAQDFGEAAIEHMAELAEIARAEEEHWAAAHPEIVPAPPEAAQQAAQEGGSAQAAFAPADVGFVSGYRFSDTVNPSKSNTPLGAETHQTASLQVAPLLAIPLAAQRRLVRAWLEMNASNIKISFRLIEQALELAHESAGKKIEMPSGWNLRRAQHDLLLESEACDQRDHATDYEYALAVPGVVKIPELGAHIEARRVDTAGVPENERDQLLNTQLIPKQILIRNWRPGDRYWPAHTSVEKKVKELLTDRHATGPQKKLWPVAVAEGSGLIWMRGFPVPEALRARTKESQAIGIRQIAGMM
jgi:tRNA(Ile)-lysidine synthase